MQLESIPRLLGVSVFVLCWSPFGAAVADDEPESASDKKPKTHKVSGVFESLDAKELKADTEHLTALKIKRILAHGKAVTKGQNVVWFETEEIDKKIKDAETDFRLAQITQQDEEFSNKQFVETQALDRAAAERTKKRAQQDYDNFAQVDRDRQKVSAEYNLKSSLASLENAQEELKQLEQMYKEDDLTEESEEIVLKRAKQSVDFAEYRLDGTKISSNRTIKQSIPRSQEDQNDALARAQLAHQKKLNDLDSARRKHEIEAARKRDKYKDEEKKIKEMREERKKVVLQSPGDGVFLHGKLTRGKLGEKPSTLQEGSSVTGSQVLGTVVNSGRLQVRVDLKEEDLSKVSVGDKCKITAKAYPNHQFNGSVKSISQVAYAGSKFDCVVTFKRGKDAPAIMPTMNCDLEFVLDDGDDTDDQQSDSTSKESKKETANKKAEK